MKRNLALAIAISAACLKFASAAHVFAHFMVQNSYAYDVDQWKTDIAAAQHVGIDGFALNWIPPNCEPGLGWTVDSIGDAFEAAEQMGFKLMQSFDMSYSTCNLFWNQSFMSQILSKYADNSATFRWNGDILVSTYGGDQVSEYGEDFFQGLKNSMKGSHPISLAPALTSFSMGAQYDAVDQANKLISDYPSIDGFLNWQAWPLNVKQNITVAPDLAFQSALTKHHKSGPYIMAVSPWQYKDLNDGKPLDSWVAYSDYLFPQRFTSLTDDAIQPDIIELLTWNDFGESHYIRDLPSRNEAAKDYVELGELGNYVWGQNHAPWRVMAKYYISWWKNGHPPAIAEDQVMYWHRIHPKSAVCAGGSSEPIRNHQFPEDAVFVWALVKEPATISMSIGSNRDWTFEADSQGPSMGSVPFPWDIPQDGVRPQVRIMRKGRTVQVGISSQPVKTSCSWENFNPVVNSVESAMKSGW